MPTTDRRARRLAIARRRERIAAQPRVGDVVIGSTGDGQRYRVTVEAVRAEHRWPWTWPGNLQVLAAVQWSWASKPFPMLYYTGNRRSWTLLVRRARRTQEGSAHE